MLPSGHVVGSALCNVHDTCKLLSPGAVAATNLMLLSTPPSANLSQNRRVKRLAPVSASDLNKCKRKIDFASNMNGQMFHLHHHGLHQQPQQVVARFSKHPTTKLQTPSVVRRNERERNRVRLVNMGFATLRQHVPEAQRNKKLSKVDTLKAACDYIKHLQELLDDTDAVEAAFQSATVPVSPSGSLEDNIPTSPEGYNSDSSYPDSAYPDSTGTDDKDDLGVDFSFFI